MKINWNEIIIKPFNFVKKHRYLWWLGLLAMLTEGGFGSNYYSSGSGWSGNNGDFNSLGNSITTWTEQHLLAVGFILITLFVISLIILYISYSARAGLIYSIDKLESDEKSLTFSQAFSAGERYFWRFLGLTLLVALLIFLTIIAFVGLIIAFVFLAIASLWFLIVVIPLGLILIAALIAAMIYFGLLLQIAYREIVIKDKKIVASLSGSKKIIKENLGQVLLGWLINIGLNLAVGLALGLVLLIVGLVLVLIGVGIYFVGKWTGVLIYVIPVALVLLVAILIISGIINAYFSAFWTLLYKELVKQ